MRMGHNLAVDKRTGQLSRTAGLTKVEYEQALKCGQAALGPPLRSDPCFQSLLRRMNFPIERTIKQVLEPLSSVLPYL